MCNKDDNEKHINQTTLCCPLKKITFIISTINIAYIYCTIILLLLFLFFSTWNQIISQAKKIFRQV